MGPDTVITAIKRLAGLGARYFVSVEKIEPLALLGHPRKIYNENSTGIVRINGWSNNAGRYNRKLGTLAGTTRTSEGVSIVLFPYRRLGEFREGR